MSEKRKTFIEPQIQFTLGHLGSSSYTTDRGTDVYLSGVNSYIGRVGVVAGKKGLLVMIFTLKQTCCMNSVATEISKWLRRMVKL